MTPYIKKFILPVSAVAVIALLLLMYFVFFAVSSPYEAIPASALAVVEIDDWCKLNGELNLGASGNAVHNTIAIQTLTDEIAFMGQLLSSSTVLKSAVYNEKITASVHLISATEFDYLYTLPFKGINTDAVLKVLKSGANPASFVNRTFKGETIVDATMKDGKRFSFTVIHHILCFSFSSFLTETAVTAFSEGDNLQNDKELKKVRAELSTVPGTRFFINFKKADVIFPVIVKAEEVSLLKDISTAQGWTGYSIKFQEDRIHLTGASFVKTDDHTQHAKNILANTIWNDIPDNAALVNADFNEMHEEETGKPDPDDILKSAFKNWVGAAHAFVILEPLREDFNEQNIFVVQVNDEGKAISGLKHLMSLEGNQPVSVDTFMGTEIFNIKDGAVINKLFGNSLVTFHKSFFAVRAKVAVFSNNADVLKFTLEKISKGETLNKDTRLLKSISQLKSGTSAVFINPAKAALLLSGIFKPRSTLQTYLADLSSISVVSDIAGQRKMMEVDFVSGDGNKEQAGLLWKTKLQAWSNYVPQIVLNNNTNEKEIFTQDTANNIYLISKSGEIIFSRNISEKVVGGVHQLSLRDDQKYQYIFNTDAHVFIIDREGNDVAGYPLRIGGQASAGLILVSSESRYYYYLPCSNGNVYGYEASGKPLPGWSPKRGLGLISKPLQTVQSKKGTLILAFNNSGSLMLLGKKADVKWRIDNLPVTNQDFSILQTTDDFVLMNASGNQLIEISADGNDKIKPFIDSASAFVALATSDTSLQYFFSSQHEVRSYMGTGAFVNAVSFKSSVISGIDLLSIFEKEQYDHYLLIKDESLRKVIIYDLNLKHLADYQVSNLKAFTITNLFDRKELIGIQPDEHGNIECYRIK